MVACPGVAHCTGLRAIHMQGLGIGVAEPAGRPIQRHIGDIRQPVNMSQRHALPDMAEGAIHVCTRLMGAHSASIVGIDGKYRLGMAAFTLGLRTVIQLQTRMVPCP